MHQVLGDSVFQSCGFRHVTRSLGGLSILICQMGGWPRMSLRRLLALTGHGFSIFLVWSKGSEEECALNREDREEGKMYREKKRKLPQNTLPQRPRPLFKKTPVRTGRLAWQGQGTAYTSPAHL